MPLPTEPIGSIPRPQELLTAAPSELAAAQERAVRETLRRLEELGSPVVTDGEQSKPSFATYPIAGLADLAPDGAVIPFADGHQRQLPRLTAGPFRYTGHAVDYLRAAQRHATAPVKQAVIAPSALSLLYPADGIDGYPREMFLDDLVDEAEADIRSCLDAGAHVVQLDFTEGRLSLKLDPSGGVLDAFIALNNRVLERFSSDERARIGVHVCPGGDLDSTHSLDVDYAELLPKLFELKAAPSTSSWPANPTPTGSWPSSPPTCPRTPASSSASSTPSTPASRRPSRSATASSPPPATCPSTASAPATTAASPRSPTTPPRPATRPSRR
ncbi:hypothetical protein ACFQY7_31080 [Actinomadura luteofluorescens]|uniref:hypothetical protein n=1 Tax=Actinomadura luteofluorescens TaxID=46163 RepID=UPI00362AAB9D